MDRQDNYKPTPMTTKHVRRDNLWRFINEEFKAFANGVPVRVILQDVTKHNAVVANYYHRRDSYTVKISSFLQNYLHVDKNIGIVS
ncbi:hypothetical protein AVT69_gp222 [Pseudomonas phage PhiPA3]|uniref:Uncharacterized protein 224 n=1 Tax=Pseudomonas phage PhiPA3 TaxID=998086 RepID=F8SJ67_BPPA3|nr:hypothetical protein AVT69_gp222 [Pseudomonas phage PhiPA3]AEH03647.1 hypothetical protein [Pseudomonas phage PhiPA3]